ncbi:transcriptional regulator, IclR family [Segniliparus rotundus DSM 44985]|uniref:Transcriptional regulator, IclR family n=1 Tax=Segniliparus rotundus (strain ATCC BAA-972 / CDC 1076 / CIP 108378 / DSM 44985 / JCM 13578) TaxID=640132 RepID=D6Z7D0_SEGRD|nr:IclR family transcriptional regulator [Segniliparus rotundus]ADG97860.1 transcriptional regulator, IclR family [Segniliparus rotundus DSM 44985]
MDNISRGSNFAEIGSSGIGVLDKSALVLHVLRRGPASLSELVERTGLPRATAHRLAQALHTHRLAAKDAEGRFTLGPWLHELAEHAADPLVLAAGQIFPALRERVGESVQLYRREGDQRVCVAAVEPASGLRDSVLVGARLSLTAGSGAQVLLAWEEPELRERHLREAAFDERALELVRERGWAHSSGEREPGVASVSIPVRDARSAKVRGALCVSGPVERINAREPQAWAALLAEASEALEEA